MNPGPLTSTTAHTWPSESAAATSSAMSRGGRPTCLARARAPLAWKSARSEGRKDGIGPGHDGVEGGLELVAQDAGGVGHPSLSHGRAHLPAPRPVRQSAGAPMAPSMSP